MEIEAKFAVPDASALERLAALSALAGYGIDAGERRLDRDTFLDTVDRRFLRAGYYLRRRETSGGVRYTLKSVVDGLGGVLRREELETELAADGPPADWPRGELRERVVDVSGGTSLEPLLALEQERLARPVHDGVREVAELSLDVVVVDAGGSETRWFEAEVELRGDGTEEDLDRLVVALREVCALAPESRAKFVRALEMVEAGGHVSLLPPAERVVHQAHAKGDDARGRRARALLALDEGLTQVQAGVRAGLSERRVRYWLARYRAQGPGIYGGQEGPSPTVDADAGETVTGVPSVRSSQKRPHILPSDTMTVAAAKTLRFHLAKMLEHEDGTRLGEDPEELHDMRVSTRRMRMALRVFDDYLDPSVMRPVLRGLRRTGRMLGAVRDLDVFYEKTRLYLDGLPKERSGDLEGLLSAWSAERDRQRERMSDYLDGSRYRAFVETLAELLDGPAERLAARPSGGPRPERVVQVLPGVLYKDMAVVWAFEGQLGGRETPLPRFHALRKACKGLRYTLEFFEGVLGPGARPLIKKVKGMQDHLGDLQDAVVTSGILRDFITWGTWRHHGHSLPGPFEIVVASDVARYLATRQEEMERLVAGFPEVWPSVAGAGFGRELATVIAEI